MRTFSAYCLLAVMLLAQRAQPNMVVGVEHLFFRYNVVHFGSLGVYAQHRAHRAKGVHFEMCCTTGPPFASAIKRVTRHESRFIAHKPGTRDQNLHS